MVSLDLIFLFLSEVLENSRAASNRPTRGKGHGQTPASNWRSLTALMKTGGKNATFVREIREMPVWTMKKMEMIQQTQSRMLSSSLSSLYLFFPYFHSLIVFWWLHTPSSITVASTPKLVWEVQKNVVYPVPLSPKHLFWKTAWLLHTA